MSCAVGCLQAQTLAVQHPLQLQQHSRSLARHQQLWQVQARGHAPCWLLGWMQPVVKSPGSCGVRLVRRRGSEGRPQSGGSHGTGEVAGAQMSLMQAPVVWGRPARCVYVAQSRWDNTFELGHRSPTGETMTAQHHKHLQQSQRHAATGSQEPVPTHMECGVRWMMRACCKRCPCRVGLHRAVLQQPRRHQPGP